VKNEFNTQLISQYDYSYNNLGLRDYMDTNGNAFTGAPITVTAETATYDTNSLNQYIEINTDNGSLTSDILSYDDDGNLTSITSTASAKVYKYNAENRLTTVEPQSPVDNDKKVEFKYDYMGHRVEKKVFTYASSAWSLTSDTLFLYDGWNMIQELNAAGVVQKSYIWGLDLSQTLQGAGGVGGLLSVVDNGETYHYLYDANGNVGQLVKASDGAIVAHYEYDPFGILLKSSGLMAADNPFWFSTKYYDSETDLYYYGYRYYSTSLGRWISRDPIEEEGGINFYSFVGNDALNYIDPLGELRVPGLTELARYMWRKVIDSVLVPRGWNVAAYLLDYALQDNPRNLTFGNGHFVSEKIKDSSEYEYKILDIISHAPIGYTKFNNDLSSITFNSGDLFAAIHEGQFLYKGDICKSSDTAYELKLDIEVSDDYNFHLLMKNYYSLGLDDILGTTANNMAWSDQYFEVINNYSWVSKIHEKR